MDLLSSLADDEISGDMSANFRLDWILDDVASLNFIAEMLRIWPYKVSIIFMTFKRSWKVLNYSYTVFSYTLVIFLHLVWRFITLNLIHCPLFTLNMNSLLKYSYWSSGTIFSWMYWLSHYIKSDVVTQLAFNKNLLALFKNRIHVQQNKSWD